MAKDPAFLFYPGDWLGGTLTFSRLHKGAYMDLLMVQYNQGHMGLQDIQQVLGSDFDFVWPKLQTKFVQDENGLYFNTRLQEEIQKRKKYTSSRLQNLQQKKEHMATHMARHMENENENENISLKKGGAGGKPEKVKHLDCVYLTEAEHAKLTERFGVQLPAIIEKLNNYKASKGKAYKSDYHAILSWVASEIAKPDPGSNGTGAAWSTVLATISTGKYKRGGSGCQKIDDAVKQCGGWYALGKLTEYQIGQMRQKFIEVYKT